MGRKMGMPYFDLPLTWWGFGFGFGSGFGLVRLTLTLIRTLTRR